MINYESLYEQNHKITELSNILTTLIQDRSICDTETCCKLFYEYMDLVDDHIHNVDSNLYTPLLRASSSEANNVANNFMSGSQEIKRIMNRYTKKWCNKKDHGLSIGAKHDEFLAQTDDMFDMILTRVQNEMEHLYPMVRKVSDD